MTQDVQLREVLPEDLSLFFAHQRDPEATRMADFPSRDQDAFVAHWRSILSDDASITRTILADGQVAGNIVCWEQSHERLVGYWLGKEYWGRGIATRALRSFLELVEPRPLHAHVAKHNVASIGVLQKCGFTICSERGGDFVLELG